MRAVIDTNVLVSALLTPGGVPSRLVKAIRAAKIIPIVSHEILGEYVDVLHRAKFGFTKPDVDDLLLDLNGLAIFLVPTINSITRLPDPSDAPFVAAAMAAACPVVTGNAKHFPARLGVQVLSPAECMQLLSTV